MLVKPILRWTLILAALSALAACSGQAATSATPAPLATSAPTATVAPSATAAPPTATALPTLTPAPIPVPNTLYVDAEQHKAELIDPTGLSAPTMLRLPPQSMTLLVIPARAP
jgi:hypothetical protein